LNLDRWLGSIGLEQYAQLFRSNEIDGDLLLRLTNDDLKEIGVSALGHRKKLLEAILALDAAPAAPSPMTVMTASGTAPDRYTPKHLAEKILTSKTALAGERKQVTVLFADLKGSMELLAERDPEEARKILDPVIERLMEAVHHYEGTVNQVMGDGIMALFGAPLAHEDHAVRACYAALRMQESIARHADTIRRSYGVQVQIRVGLNSGEVVVRSVGSDLRMDYTAVGQTTHLAARMEQLAPPGTAWLTAQTVRLAEGYVEVKSLGPIPVKGLPDPIEVFQLTGSGIARTRLQASALRGLTRFVGRDAEIAHMRRVLSQAGAGHGQVVAIVGEAGVGKSRLVNEFTHSHRVQDWLILDAPSVSYGKATSYVPVIDLLKGYFRIGIRDDHREMRDKVLGRVLGLDRALEPLLPALLALLDVPADDPAWQNLDPPHRRQRTLDAVKRLLLRESLVQPLLVVFEDLHWVDGETQALLDNLVESLGSARLLLLVNYRPEYEHRWGSKTAYSQLRLDSLPAASTAELLAALLGPDPGLAPLMQMLVKRGNPFFLEETVRTLVETGTLVGERGAYQLVRSVEALQVPATVQAILAARIDRLPPQEKYILQAASAIGKHVPDALLAAIAEQPQEALRHGLAHLQEAEFLYETQVFPDLEHTFKHALTHEVTYGSLLQARRRELHGQIAAALERLYADRLDEYVERLAHHALRGEVWDKATTYLHLAGLRSMARAAYREAVGHLEGALEALQHLPPSRERSEVAIDVRFELRTSLFPLGETERMRDHLREAESLAAALGDQQRLGRVSNYMVIQSLFDSDYEAALRFGRRALDIAVTLGDISIEAPANAYMGTGYVNRGELAEAVRHLQRNSELLTGDLLHERFGQANIMASYSRSVLAFTLAELGRFAEAISYAEEAVQIAEDAGQRFALTTAWVFQGLVHAARGDFPRAIAALERGVELSRTSQFTLVIRWTAASLAHVLSLAGHTAEALALAAEAGRARAPWIILPELDLVHLGTTHLIAGNFDEATHFAEDAIEAFRRKLTRGGEAHAAHLLAQIAAWRDPPDVEAAEFRYLQALALSAELGMRPLEAHCRFGLGELHAAAGRHEKAQDHLAAATALYREMDMAFWLEKVEVKIKGLS